eukprot:TRINITY_DN3709_c0_g3_i1.p1 TRINITY_DN3709_c0_g3~~TRINITY_DN3709_c0_g3_i1.p1  ORF type:complete len:1410 (-),score=591.25 TRINITY_DN3709_c0_g3_i1:49-4278(-)
MSDDFYSYEEISSQNPFNRSMTVDSNQTSTLKNEESKPTIEKDQNHLVNHNNNAIHSGNKGENASNLSKGASGFFSKFFYRSNSKDKEKEKEKEQKKEEKENQKREEKEEKKDSRFDFMKKKTKSVGNELTGPSPPSSPKARNRSGSVSSPPSSPSLKRKSIEKEEKNESRSPLKSSTKLPSFKINRASIEKKEEKGELTSPPPASSSPSVSPRKKFTQRSETSAVLVSSGSSKSSQFKTSPTTSASDPFIGNNTEEYSMADKQSEAKIVENEGKSSNQKHGLRRIMSDDSNLRVAKSGMRDPEENSQISTILFAFKQVLESKKLELIEMELTQIPLETFDLTLLLELNLSKNKLTSISPSIKNLINLKSLNVSSNQLTSLPCEIGTLKNLVDLKISFNPLPPDIKLAHWRGNLKELLQKIYQNKKKEMQNPSPNPSKLSEWTKPKQQPLQSTSLSAFSYTTKMEKTKVSKNVNDRLKQWEKQLPMISFGEELSVSKKNNESTNPNNNNNNNNGNNNNNTTNSLANSSNSIQESNESNRITNNNAQNNSNVKDNFYQPNANRNNASSRNLSSGNSRRNLNSDSNGPSLLRSPLKALRLLSTSQNMNPNGTASNSSDNSDSDSIGSSSDETMSTDTAMRSAVNAALEWKEENNNKIISKNYDVEIIGVTEVPLVVRAIGVGKLEKSSWLEQLVAISDANHENINSVVAVMKFNRKRTKFRLGEPSWVNQMTNQSNEDSFLVFTERCSGNNMREWNVNHLGQSFLLKKRMQMIQQVAYGMQFLHSKDIIHHNLKLSNVILYEKGMRITDYFLGNRMMKDYTEELIQINESRRLSVSNPSTPNNEGIPLQISSGSISNSSYTITLPYWNAPEILENEEYNEKIDVYSFGMLLYELITTKIPFEHIKTMEELVQFVCIQNERPSLEGEKVPKSIMNLFDICTRKEPSERPSFLQILENFHVYLVESVCEDENAAKFWWTEFRGEESIEWKRFLAQFFTYFKAPMEVSKDPVLIEALRSVLVDSDEAVTMENFSKMTQWFGPMDGVDMLQRMIKLHSQPWFYGNLSSIQAEDALADKGRGTFLIRFSSSNPGSFAISVNSEEGPVKHYKIWHKPGQGYSLGKEEFSSFEALISNRRDLLFLRVPCAKGEKYSDSNFWATQESVEGGDLKTVVSLKKLCFRHIYRKSHLYQNLEAILPADLLEDYRCAIIDSATTDEVGRNLWKDCWLLQDLVSFDQFASALCVFLNTTLVPNTQNYNCLRMIIQDINDSKTDAVSTETFSKLLEWFGPLDALFLDKIAEITTKPWFHGNMSHQQAEKLVLKHNAKKGTFLIRFSSKNRGYFTITVLGRNKSLLHYRVYYNRQEIKYVIGKKSFNSLDDIIRDYYRELYLKSPCPGSKFLALMFDPFLMQQQQTQ